MLPANATHYPIEIAGVRRELPLMAVQPQLRIAVLNILGDVELVEAAARALAARLAGQTYTALVTAEAKSIPLAHALAVQTGKPYVVLRKQYKSYMGQALHSETLSITTGKPQQLFLDEKDAARLAGQAVVLVDDVISTGSTLHGMTQLVTLAGARVAAVAAVLTEGDDVGHWQQVIALGHLPLFHGSIA